MNFVNPNINIVANTFNAPFVPQGLTLIDAMLNANITRLNQHAPGSPEHLVISRRIETLNKQKQEILQAQTTPIESPSFENFISTPTNNLVPLQASSNVPLQTATSNNSKENPVLSAQDASRLQSFIVSTPQSEAEAKRNILISLILYISQQNATGVQDLTQVKMLHTLVEQATGKTLASNRNIPSLANTVSLTPNSNTRPPSSRSSSSTSTKSSDNDSSLSLSRWRR